MQPVNPARPAPAGPPSMPPLATPTSGLAGMPGLRTLRSPGFRLLIALTVVLLGGLVLGAAMVRQASQPGGQFGIDLGDYLLAAERIAATGTPYAPEMLAGPVDAQGLDRYRYPPPLAQLLVPVSGLGAGTAATIWLVLQLVATVGAVWLALGVAGVRRHAERLAWSLAACVLFMPVFDTLWKGNVSGFVALAVTLVAMGGAAAGAGAMAATLLKVVPLTFLPAIAAGGRRAFAAAAVTGGAVVGLSLVLAPQAWADYLVVLPNLLAGSSDHATNLAPAATLGHMGAPDVLVDAVRMAALALAAGCTIAAPLLIRHRPDRHGWAAAATLGTAAMLLLPAACWYHYLVALLPVAALAWPAASGRARGALLAGGLLVSAGVAVLPAATLGATLLLAVALTVHLRVPPTLGMGAAIARSGAREARAAHEGDLRRRAPVVRGPS